MGIAAILVMWPRHYEQIFLPPSHGGSICNLVSNGLVVLEEMSFENVEEANAAANINDVQRTTAYPIGSPGAFGTGELKRK